jgi:hypothetical protein
VSLRRCLVARWGVWLGGAPWEGTVTVHSSGLFDSVPLELLRERTGRFRADDLPAV